MLRTKNSTEYLDNPPFVIYLLTTNNASDRRVAEEEINLRAEVEEDCDAFLAALRTANIVSWSW